MPNDAKATPVAIEPEGDWYGLYKSTSRDDHLFTAASVKHPAKCSLALCNKILDTMQEWGWIETGSLVVDPFGGRGTTALCWLARNAANRALTVELEPHFVEMQNRNKEHAERRLHRELAWVILQGDSRRFAEYYAEGKAASVLSAPYDSLEAQQGAVRGGSEGLTVALCEGAENWRLSRFRNTASTPAGSHRQSPRQRDHLGALRRTASTASDRCGLDAKAPNEFTYARPAADSSDRSSRRDCCECTTRSTVDGWARSGDLKDPPAASVLSAPYEKAVPRSGAGGTRGSECGSQRAYERGVIAIHRRVSYGSTPGQIGNLRDTAMLPSSPRRTQPPRTAGRQARCRKARFPTAITRAYDATNHGQTDGQIANLPDKDVVAVTSAPYGGLANTSAVHLRTRRLKRALSAKRCGGAARTRLRARPDCQSGS
jgi:hypothetical protein